MSEQMTITHERTDAIPVILAFLRQMRVAELLDKHFPPHGHWTGLSLGQMLSVWLTFILSQGDHRLSHVEPWIAAHQQTLSRCLNQQVLPRDGTEDRLARGLDDLGVVDNGVECECELNQTRIRVYNLHPKTTRVDPTTVSAYVTPDGMFQLGHSKDYRSDLPQLKIALSTLDPLGLPMTIAAVAGNTADDPLYLPEIAKVRRSVGQTGMTDIGDCKIAALATRADIAAHDDFYLCPLSAKQVSAEELERRLEPVWSGQQPLGDVRLTDESNADDDEEADAVRFSYTSATSRQGPSRQPRRLEEPRLVARSLAHPPPHARRRRLSERIPGRARHAAIERPCVVAHPTLLARRASDRRVDLPAEHRPARPGADAVCRARELEERGDDAQRHLSGTARQTD